MMTTAQLKGRLAHFAQDAPMVWFEVGEGNGEDLAVIRCEVDGQRALFLVPVPPVGAPPDLLAAYSARATASLTGRCPLCDAVNSVGENNSTMLHEADCLASTEALLAAVAAHWATGRNDPCPCGSGLKFKKCHGG